MNKPKNLKKSKISFLFVLKLTKTIILSMVVFCCLLIALYIVGNYQHFQDKSQQIILNTLSYFSIGTLFLTIPVIVESIIRLFTVSKKKDSIITLILMIISILITIGSLGFSSFVGFLSEGITEVF